jgi:hypothetical protein
MPSRSASATASASASVPESLEPGRLMAGESDDRTIA